MTMTSKSSVLSYLYGLQKFGIKLGLRNIEFLLETLGHPERDFPAVHIAGTNGKGSTSSMIAAMLRAAGYRVGLYTSPHLIDFNERIRVNGKKIPDRALIRYTARLRPAIDARNATFFEATTAVAFRYFADRGVDIAVVETGLGGRLDATNVLTPLVSVITSIGLDHTDILGATLGKIAREKAGIIKPGVPCVIGSVPPAAKKVLLRRAAANSSPVIAVEEIGVEAGGDGSLTIRTSAHRYRSIDLSLRGAFQRTNAAAAVAAIEQIQSQGFRLSNAAIREGLHRVRRLSGIEGRVQIVERRPLLICDVAHNPEAAGVLVDAVRGIPHEALHLVFGVMKDKDYRTMIRRFAELDPEFYAVQASIARSLPSSDLAAAIEQAGGAVRSYASIAAALRAARRAASSRDMILVTGSHYVVGEALRMLRQKAPRK
jgi:dihydrofolate synthase / folylpolyglutamate synthase